MTLRAYGETDAAESSDSSAPRSGRVRLESGTVPRGSALRSVHAYAIDGPLDAGELGAALSLLGARYELGSFAVRDLRERDVTPERAVEQWRRDTGESVEAAFEALILQLGQGQHWLVFAGGGDFRQRPSPDVLLEHLLTTYEASGVPPVVASPARERLHRTDEWTVSEADVEAALDYCAECVGAANERIEWPTLGRRTPRLAALRAVQTIPLNAALLAELRALAARHSSSLRSVLLAGFQALLSRYSGHDSLLIALRDGVGDAADSSDARPSNVVPLRANLAHDPTFAELLDRVRVAEAEALRHRDVPWELIEERLSAGAALSFDAEFSYAPGTALQLERSALRISRVLVGGEARADLTLACEIRGDEVDARFCYSTEALDAEFTQRLARNYLTLLEAAASRPETRINDLELLHEHEREALRALNRTDAPSPRDGGFHEAIREQAEATPDRIAVVSDGEALTYAELEQRATRLANYLVARGVQKQSRVGVAVGRSARLLEATLGVLKAGATYVPLDPDFPAERLAYMVEDAKIGLIVTEAALRARLPSEGFVAVLLDSDAAAIAASSLTPPDRDVAPSDIGYVIYTSGSTGRPKGVQVPHGAIGNFLSSMARVPGCSPEDRVVAVTTLSFDIAVLELFLPLTVGARTIIAPRECLTDGKRLARLLAEQGATTMQATPTTWQLLVDAGWPGQPGFQALCGGEAFPGRLARELILRCDAVWNMYGPTETTVWSTCQRLTDPDAPILVGKPIANTQTYVLDANLSQLPFGVTGELYIGGLGVTAGYLDRPELTEQRFVPDEFSGSPGARLYRTGDLARQWPSGIQLLGRADNQIKLRGHRIELGEIESVLESDPQIARCAVVVREVGPNDERLVAYYTAAEGANVDTTRLRNAARDRLPDYMVPQHFVELDRLPQTPNGKIDRKALPAYHAEAEPDEAPRAAPQNRLEALLIEIWSRVLRIDRIGTTDDFFALGGHSLLAVQLVQAINDACNTQLEIGFVFEASTIQKQAAWIDEGRQDGGVRVVPLQPQGAGTPLFCICGINLYQALARNLGEERPVYGIFLPVEALLLQDTDRHIPLREMATEYVRAIRAKQPEGPYCLAGVSFGAVLAYEVAQQLRAAQQPVEFVAILDVVLDNGMRRSPALWLRAHLKRLGEHGPRYLVDETRRHLRRKALSLSASDKAAGVRVRVVRQLVELIGESPSADAPAPQQSEMDRLLQLRERHYQRAWEEYKAGMQPYDGTVVVIRAAEQPKAAGGYVIDRDCGWSAYVRGGSLHCHDVPGDHLGILDEPNVRHLARLLGHYFPLQQSAQMAAE